jgi:hypothetical protein
MFADLRKAAPLFGAAFMVHVFKRHFHKEPPA